MRIRIALHALFTFFSSIALMFDHSYAYAASIVLSLLAVLMIPTILAGIYGLSLKHTLVMEIALLSAVTPLVVMACVAYPYSVAAFLVLDVFVFLQFPFWMTALSPFATHTYYSDQTRFVLIILALAASLGVAALSVFLVVHAVYVCVYVLFCILLLIAVEYGGSG